MDYVKQETEQHMQLAMIVWLKSSTSTSQKN
jgi:hypothetical protein